MYKTRLQELCNRYRWKCPDYESTMDGPSHMPKFQAHVMVNGHSFDTHDQYNTKKAAQNEAARIAFEHFSGPQFAPSEDASSSRNKVLSWVGTAKEAKHEFKEIEYTFSDPSSVDLAYLQQHVQPELPATPVEKSKEDQGNPEDMIHPSFDLYKSNTYIVPSVKSTSLSSTNEDITMVENVGQHPNHVLPPQSIPKFEEKKPPIAVDSNSSSASTVLKSIGVLDLTNNEKSPGRISLSSESTTTRSPSCQGKSKATVSNALTSRKKFSLLSSPSYWLSHIKISESASKHSVSLGFFKLALEAECEPIHVLKNEVKSYANRHDLGEQMKEVLQLYNIPKLSRAGAGSNNLESKQK